VQEKKTKMANAEGTKSDKGMRKKPEVED